MDRDQIIRYSRQIRLPQVDVTGQQRLLTSTALIVGLGGLGSPAALYLAAAGVGRLILIDPDRVELSNLHRQIIHGTADVGRLKVDSARERLLSLNPGTVVETVHGRLEGTALDAVVGHADVVIDASDNFAARYAINAACVHRHRPLVSGAAIRLQGQVGVFDLRRDGAACYHCLFADGGAEQADTCSGEGVLGPVVGIIGAVQAAEALKLLLDLPGLGAALLLLDALTMTWRRLPFNRDPACPVCAPTSSPAAAVR